MANTLTQNTIYFYEKTEELPPTPSSSTMSFLANEKDSMHDKSEESSLRSHQSRYGSIESTISPNDDDEDLYLLWTHQLLKERGYEPSPLKQIMNDDCDSIDSSITEDSTTLKRSWFSTWLPFCYICYSTK